MIVEGGFMPRFIHMLRSGLCGAAGAAGVCLGLGVILASLTIANTVAGYFFEFQQFAFAFAPIVAVQAVLGFLFGAARAVRPCGCFRQDVASVAVNWAILAAPLGPFVGVILVLDSGGRAIPWGELLKLLVALTGHLLCGVGAGLNVGLYLRRGRQSTGL